MVTVTVPATSANVGAGFDSLGLAVSMHNVFTFEESDRIQISSVDGTHVPAGSNNLVYRSARVVYDQLGIPLKGLRITQRNDIPMARGLGSSSACIVAGIMGASWGGDHTFTNVTVQNINISGFHNLAGILGYDASGLISEYSFENCKVEGATMVFSYCLSPNYTTDMPRRFVSVFYNGPKWVDNIDACVEQGNTFSGVSFYDWTSTEEVDEYGNKKVSAMTEFSPDNFRSWTQEEADA